MKRVLMFLFCLAFVFAIFSLELSAQQAKLVDNSAASIQPPAALKKPDRAAADQAAADEALINRYFESLNEPDDKRRLVIEKEIWATDAKFSLPSPFVPVQGIAAIDASAKGALVRFPNAKVRRTTFIERSGEYIRYGFLMSENDGKPLSAGMDVCLIVNGKLQSVAGFFDYGFPNAGEK